MPQEVEVRLITTSSEFEQIKQVRQRVFVEEQKVNQDVEFDERDVEFEAGLVAGIGAPSDLIYAIAVDPVDGCVVGTARSVMSYSKLCKAKIGRVAVDRSHRRAGVGRALMVLLHEEARRRGALCAELGAQMQAVPFYMRMGYQIIPESDFVEVGIPHVLCRIDLSH